MGILIYLCMHVCVWMGVIRDSSHKDRSRSWSYPRKVHLAPEVEKPCLRVLQMSLQLQVLIGSSFVSQSVLPLGRLMWRSHRSSVSFISNDSDLPGVKNYQFVSQKHQTQ